MPPPPPPPPPLAFKKRHRNDACHPLPPWIDTEVKFPHYYSHLKIIKSSVCRKGSTTMKVVPQLIYNRRSLIILKGIAYVLCMGVAISPSEPIPCGYFIGPPPKFALPPLKKKSPQIYLWIITSSGNSACMSSIQFPPPPPLIPRGKIYPGPSHNQKSLFHTHTPSEVFF